jgi:ankyrin repeat protein
MKRFYVHDHYNDIARAVKLLCMQRFTPLMLANACGELKVMQYLLDAGANVNIITNVSQTKLVLVVSVCVQIVIIPAQYHGSTYGML